MQREAREALANLAREVAEMRESSARLRETRAEIASLAEQVRTVSEESSRSKASLASELHQWWRRSPWCGRGWRVCLSVFSR
jgi:hypothetical protein